MIRCTMVLEPGGTHYEIVSSLGARGMGEVYRAKDTKLGREVAVKLRCSLWLLIGSETCCIYFHYIA